MRGVKYDEVKGSPLGRLKPHSLNGLDNFKETVAIFGDSNFYGYGLKDKQMLHNVLKTERIVNNFAYPSEGNIHIFRKMVDIFSEYGFPSTVLVCWSSHLRVPVVREHNGNQQKSIGTWTRDLWDYDKLGWPDDVAGTVEFIEKAPLSLRHISIDIIKGTRLMLKNVNYMEWTCHIQDDDLNIPQLPFIDNTTFDNHPGPKTIRNLAEVIGVL